MVFMAIAIASWASGESAPNDIPAESKRGKIASTDSTCSTGIGLVVFNLNKSRIVAIGRLFTNSAYSLKSSYLPERTALCSELITSGLNA